MKREEMYLEGEISKSWRLHHVEREAGEVHGGLEALLSPEPRHTGLHPESPIGAVFMSFYPPPTDL